MEFVENIFVALAYIAALGFLINGLDDLFFDCQFLVYLWRNRKKPHITLPQLKGVPEQWIALMVPAWQEGGVVNKMAEYAARVILYEKFDIFIGVYPNDPETNKCVDELCAQNPRIHKVLVPHAGPSSKADCLNWIYRAVRLNEIAGTKEYKVLAIHDAEDVIHPLVLKVYNYFIPKYYDMGQVPVFALEMGVLKYWTANSYIDDFAELHTKDLFARETMGGVVPSAGVGTAFSRATLEKLAADNNGDPFFIGNLTEDYEVAIRVKRAGLRAGLISVPVDRIVRPKRRDGALGPPQTISEIVAVRETFPHTFRMAVRQRSRWILGISFQTWEQAGWAGDLPMRYTLARDRRAPLTHLINMIGYVVLAYVILQWLFLQTPWASELYIRPLFNTDSLMWKIIIIDSLLLVYRAIQKVISVQSIYNFKQAAFSIPRVVVGNVINFIATLRATKMYLAHKLFGKPIVWLKTAHVFPGEATLAEYTRSIEDLLVEEGLFTREQIFQALKLERGSAPLCLLRMGLIEEKDFTGVWSRHSRLEVRFIHPYEVPQDLLGRFPEKQSIELEAFPVEQKENQTVIAFREPPDAPQLETLAQSFGMKTRPVLARPSNILFCRDRAYPRLVLPPSRLAEHWEQFREAAEVEATVLLDLVSSRHVTRQSLPDVMIDRGLLSEPEARRLWGETIGLPPANLADLTLNQERYFKVGPSFWWLHRMMPINGERIATAIPLHEQLKDWMATKLGSPSTYVTELPSKIELGVRNRGVDIDPDQILLDCLAAKGILTRDELPKLKSMRELIADPLPKWLLLQRQVSEEQLHQTFLEICYLPPVTEWNANEVMRLRPVLPPGFAEETRCYCLQQSANAIRIGLAQMPSTKALREIHDRLSGYALFFQALTYEDAVKLRTLERGKQS